jgi:hypothetical protein
MEKSNAAVQKEILEKMAALVAKGTQDRVQGKTPDHNLLVSITTELVTTYGVQAVLEASLSLGASIDKIMTKSTPPPSPDDGASQLVN